MEYSTRCVRLSRGVTLDNACSKDSSYIYSRYSNETREELESTIAHLYGDRARCYCLASGMSCLSLLLKKLGNRPILADEHIHSEAKELLEISGSNVQFFDFTDVNSLRSKAEQGDILLFDCLRNPTCVAYDVKQICDIAKEKGMTTIVDNTLLTSYYSNPFDCGANFVIESLSKYCCGHGDSLGGSLLCNVDLSMDIALNGCAISPFNAWLIRRGLATLPLRIARISETTSLVNKWLSGESHIIGGDSRCGIIVFGFGTEKQHKQFMQSLKLIRYSFSFGQDNTLISECLSNVDDAACMRLCIGLEAPKDIIDDLQQAFKTIGV